MAEILDPVAVEKLEAVKRFKRFHSWKKSVRYFVLFSVPVIICFSLFDLKEILPFVREVCLVKIPEIWHLCTNERFLFLLSNVIIMSLAANSGLLNPSSSDGGADLYEEFVRKSKTVRKYSVYASQPVLAEEKTVAGETTVQGSSQAKYGRSKTEIVKRTARQSDRKLRRSESEQTAQRSRNSEEAASNHGAVEADVADEELDRRCEEFIAKFQREMRLQGQKSFIHSC